jgi:hypothetical protein
MFRSKSFDGCRPKMEGSYEGVFVEESITTLRLTNMVTKPKSFISCAYCIKKGSKSVALIPY